MHRDRSQEPSTRGLPASLLAGIRAGAVCGLAFGILDGVVAARVGHASLRGLSFLGCLAGAVLQYSLLGVLGLATLALALHPLLSRRPAPERFLALLRVGLSLGIFAELYWWTRPYVFYGHSASSPPRLIAAAILLAVAVLPGSFLAARIVRVPRPVSVVAVVLLVASWLGGGLYLWAQSSAISSRGAINERNRDMPNLVLVVVDALRQDVLGCYGNTRVKTPGMDALAAEGVLFENAFTQAPFTWTSFSSLLTGKYPRRHGLVIMRPGIALRPNITLPWHLKTARGKDGTALQDGDYLTASFHAGTLSAGTGLLRGFDLLLEGTAGHDLVAFDSPWSVFRSNLLLWVFRNKLTQRFDASITGSEARKWLSTVRDRRFMTMVHLYSTHTPYDPPAEFKELYEDPGYSGPLRSFWAHHRVAIEQGRYALTSADVEQIKNLYYAGVTQADRMIGDLVAELERCGLRDNTLVIVTSDHGESLGERDLWEHVHMEQTNLRVPLIMSWPRGLPRGTRVRAMTDEIDVLPTVCDLLGLDLPREEGERGRIDGTSLVPLVRGDAAAVREFSFAENGTHLSIQDPRLKLIVPRDMLESPGWTADRAGPGDQPRLYDLALDPGEEHDIASERPEDADRLAAALRAWNASLPIPLHDTLPSDRNVENQRVLLRALGYTEGEVEDEVHPVSAPERASAGSPREP